MRKRFFVAGTDTDVGKTLVSAALLVASKNQGCSTLGLKPIAAGCEESEDGLRNEDAVTLSTVSTVKLPYSQVNPVALSEPIAPHIAAQREGRRLSVDRVVGICRGALMQACDVAIVEGAGGWRVPLGPRETMADLAKAMEFPVILVVGMRLGCLNHALLTYEAIMRDGLPVAGWVANVVDPEMPALDENIHTLDSALGCPRLGTIPFQKGISPADAASYLDISKLLETDSV